jgi:hypothetical protein
MSTIQCALYCKHCAKYSAHPLVYATWTVVPSIYYVITAPHIQASIFNWTYLGWYWWYVENSMRLIPQSWCQMLRIYSSLRYVNCGPAHIQCSYISAFSGFSMLQYVPALLLMISRQCNMRYTANWEPSTAHVLQFTLCELVVPAIYSIVTAPHIQASIFSRRYLRWYWRYLDNSLSVILQSRCQIQRTHPGLRYVYCGPGHIQWNYSYVYSGFNIQVNVSAVLFVICEQYNARYTANLVP